MNTRAQSIGISKYFLGLVVGAVVIWIVNEISRPMLASSRNATNNAVANQGTTWFSQFLDFLPVAIPLIALMGVIVLAVYQREVLR